MRRDETRRDEARRLITLVFRLPAISESHPGRPFRTFRILSKRFLRASAPANKVKGMGKRTCRTRRKTRERLTTRTDKSRHFRYIFVSFKEILYVDILEYIYVRFRFRNRVYNCEVIVDNLRDISAYIRKLESGVTSAASE